MQSDAEGSVLVCDDMEVENLACKLKMHRFKVPFEVGKWQELKEELVKAMMHLRCVSYGPSSVSNKMEE